MYIAQNALLSWRLDFGFEGNRTFLARKISFGAD
jgi:hypothetical protein